MDRDHLDGDDDDWPTTFNGCVRELVTVTLTIGLSGLAVVVLWNIIGCLITMLIL